MSGVSIMSGNHINMFGGSPLNRLSWLRTSHQFLNAVVVLPTTRWLLFDAGQPLVVSTPDAPSKIAPIFLTTHDVQPFIGDAPYFGQAQRPGETVSEDGTGEHSPTKAARHHQPPIVFLGLHEVQANGTTALPSSDFTDPDIAIKKLEGTPYFAMDVADLEFTPEHLQEILTQTTPGREGRTFSWSEPRALMSGLDSFTAAVFASARSLTDWNHRNKFCAGCGSRAYSMWGGWKIGCKTLLPWADNTGRKPCITVKGLHNFTHPRTDGVVIMITVDETGDKILLGRGKRFPGNFYSALAGFIEPGESFEDAVAREMWEEAGVNVWNIKYHSGQPWPYPASLMVGFYARANSSQLIRTDLDGELADARWFTREEVLAVLGHRSGTKFGKADYKAMSENAEARDNQADAAKDAAKDAFSPDEKPAAAIITTQTSTTEPPFRVPPATAIAGVLIRDWADGKIGYGKDESFSPAQKNNL